jgi:hypothetical protein
VGWRPYEPTRDLKGRKNFQLLRLDLSSLLSMGFLLFQGGMQWASCKWRFWGAFGSPVILGLLKLSYSRNPGLAASNLLR